jgi:hypothetical protein
VQFQVIITPSAKADIFEINTWFLENYPDLAEKWLWGISKPLHRFRNFPKDVRLAPKVRRLTLSCAN